jgi:hypothetical protein
MQKSWEFVLGQRVLVVQLEGGGWQWRCDTLSIAHDPKVRFATAKLAILNAGAMVYAAFVVEETTGDDASSEPFHSGPRYPRASSPGVPPPQGSGGG